MANQSLTQLFFQFFNPRRLMFWIGLFAILCILAAVYGYYYFYLPSKMARKYGDVSNHKVISGGQGDGSDVLIYFFHVDWCPHCKTAQPEWQAFSDNFNNRDINGYVIRCIDQDCTEKPQGTKDPEIEKLINDFDIKGYPTVKMVKNSKTIDFDANVSQKNLEQFIIHMVGPTDAEGDKDQG